MFCPKCGIQNPDEGKFCRACGTDLSAVSKALNKDKKEAVQNLESDPSSKKKIDDLFSAGIKNSVLGIGFLIISMVLLITNAANGHTWWWTMLIPAFALLARGIGDIAKANRFEKRNVEDPVSVQKTQITSQTIPSLLSSQADFSEINNLVKSGKKLEAIKVHRELFGSKLNEAKKVIEKIEKEISLQKGYVAPPQKSIYDTEELPLPSSVTENTTRLLETNTKEEKKLS
jgi:ribosomal protein L40E